MANEDTRRKGKAVGAGGRGLVGAVRKSTHAEPDARFLLDAAEAQGNWQAEKQERSTMFKNYVHDQIKKQSALAKADLASKLNSLHHAKRQSQFLPGTFGSRPTPGAQSREADGNEMGPPSGQLVATHLLRAGSGSSSLVQSKEGARSRNSKPSRGILPKHLSLYSPATR